MRPPILLRSLLVTILSVTLLTPGAFAKNAVSTAPPKSGETSVEVSELPLYMQLLAYVAELLSAGKEVPKALLNKIEAYSKSSK